MKPKPTIVFLNRFYWPDVAATGQMLSDLAESFAGDGWDVRVITSRGRYASGEPLARRETHGGVRITRVRGTLFGRETMLGRVADYASYLLGAFFGVLRVPRGSVIVGMTDPPFIGAVAVLGARLRGGKAIHWVQDVFPEIAVQLEALHDRGLAHRALHTIARAVHRGSDRVVVLGPAMRDRIESAGVRPDRLSVIHNWAPAEIVPVCPAENPFVERHGLRSRFVVLYSGNAGRAHRFDSVIEAMRRLRDRRDILFVFIGGGHRIPELKAAVAEDGLTNALFLDYQPRAALAQSLSAAGVSLITEDQRVVGLLVPSKTYGILASGRPILFVGSDRSDVAALVREVGCGEVVDPNDPGMLVDAIIRLAGDESARTEMGRRARGAALGRFGRARSYAAWSELLESMA